MLELELKDNMYRIGTLNVFEQWNVSRRLMPILGSLTDVEDDDSLTKALMPALLALGNMSDEDTEYVLNTCLNVVMRKSPAIDSAWAKVLGGKNTIMFADIDMATMLRLTITVIVENMGSFFTRAALEDSIAAAMRHR